MIYEKLSEINFKVSGLDSLDPRQKVLFASPDYFDVQYVINPHMKDNIGKVDRELAWVQWTKLRKMYTSLGLGQHIIPGAHKMPDMVFCANQTLPYVDEKGNPGVFLSKMNAPERSKEVTHFGHFFMNQSYELTSLPESFEGSFEGMGDALWHPSRRLLFGGHGFRTSLDVYHFISDEIKVPIIALELSDPDFYHLDTCLCMLSEKDVLIYRGAFDAEGNAMIDALFENVIEAPEAEARKLFACNAHCPDQKNVIIQSGCTETKKQLESAGYVVHEVETGEFLKSGGSVFCMKMMFW